MMQRWSFNLTEPLRTFLRRGVLLLLGGVAAVIVTVSPLATKPASAAVLDFGLGGNSCAIETVGWVICPTMRSISRLADKGFMYINQSSLSIDYDLFDSGGKTYVAWQTMRNIANGLFVIVFLIIIYSYLVGRVNGPYNLKRLLPRLLIAAIAGVSQIHVNNNMVSWFKKSSDIRQADTILNKRLAGTATAAPARRSSVRPRPRR